MSDDVQCQIDALGRRVQALEDELAIQRVILSYGFAVDSGDADWTAELFANDAVYDIDVLTMHGRDDVRRMVLGERHQALIPNCAHTIGPISVSLDGDHASAIGYSRLYLRKSDEMELWRRSFNRWELERRDHRWQITRRTTRVLGHDEASELFKRGSGKTS